MTRPAFGPRDVEPSPGALTRREIGELFRAAAVGFAVDGDMAAARRARASARAVERRDGVGERYRRHVRRWKA